MKKKAISIIIAVIVIIAAVLGILYFTTDLFKTPEQLFYKYYAKSLKFPDGKSYASTMTDLKKQLELPMETSGEITAKMTSKDADDKEIASILGKGKITYNTKIIGAEQKAKCDLTLNYDNRDIVTLNLLKNKEQYGIKVAEAYDKYVSVENNNLKALFKKLGMDTTDIPDKIEVLDYYELLNIDKATLEHIEKTYSDIIKENVPAENYSVEKNVTVKIDGVDITTNAYKLTLTEEQVNNILTKVLETLKTDDITLELIVNKYNMIVKPYQTMAKLETITKEKLIEEIDKLITESNQPSETSNASMELIVYGEKENRTRIEENIQADGKQITRVTIDSVKTDENKKTTMLWSTEDINLGLSMLYNDAKADITVKVADNDTMFELNVKENMKSTENVTIEDFASDNSVKLNDMTEAEIAELVQTMYTNVMQALPKKMELLGINPFSLNSEL